MAKRSRFISLSRTPGRVDLAALAGDPEVVWAAVYRAEPDETLLQRHRFGRSEFVEVVEVEAHFPPAGGEHTFGVEQRRLLSRFEEPENGVWLIAPMYRAANISAATFQTHWTEEHGPLALAHHPGLIEYRQNVVIDRRERDPELDGIAVLGFPNAQAFAEELFDSPRGRSAIAADMARFVDTSRASVALMTEYLIKA